MGKGATPPPVDWKGLQAGITSAASSQLQNNRLNTSNPWASQTFNPDGSVSSQFTGGMGQAATGLQNQAAGMAQPMDWSQFGTVGTGDQARDQAIQGAYGQATSRLDPQWNQREESMRAQLTNQGLEPDSQAFQNAMGDFGRQRNDAYSSAMNGAIGQGTAAGSTAFQNNLMSQQANIANALRARGLPLQEMQQLQGLLGGQPQYSQDNSSLAGQMGAAQFAKSANEQEFQQEQARQAAAAGDVGGLLSGAGSVMGMAAMFF